jgi:hypothetical protein
MKNAIIFWWIIKLIWNCILIIVIGSNYAVYNIKISLEFIGELNIKHKTKNNIHLS